MRLEQMTNKLTNTCLTGIRSRLTGQILYYEEERYWHKKLRLASTWITACCKSNGEYFTIIDFLRWRHDTETTRTHFATIVLAANSSRTRTNPHKRDRQFNSPNSLPQSIVVTIASWRHQASPLLKCHSKKVETVERVRQISLELK